MHYLLICYFTSFLNSSPPPAMWFCNTFDSTKNLTLPHSYSLNSRLHLIASVFPFVPSLCARIQSRVPLHLVFLSLQGSVGLRLVSCHSFLPYHQTSSLEGAWFWGEHLLPTLYKYSFTYVRKNTECDEMWDFDKNDLNSLPCFYICEYHSAWAFFQSSKGFVMNTES